MTNDEFIISLITALDGAVVRLSPVSTWVARHPTHELTIYTSLTFHGEDGLPHTAIHILHMTYEQVSRLCMGQQASGVFFVVDNVLRELNDIVKKVTIHNAYH